MSAKWKTREQMEEGERAALASVAQKSGESRGRQHREPSHAYRTEFQRDRARIIHSRAFRRLEYKTQVFLNGTGDHLRTRLTHSIEVASISRTIARALRLNEDLAEAIALAHDLAIRLLDIPARRCWRNACATTADSIIIDKVCAWSNCSKRLIQIFRA